jgi:hypothetical protein
MSYSLHHQFRVSASASKPLRVGIILDSWVLARWCDEVIEDIVASNFANIELLIFNGMAKREMEAVPPAESRWRAFCRILRTPQLRRKLLYSLYDRRDAATIPSDISPFVPTSCEQLLSGVPQIVVEPTFETFVHRLTPEDVLRIDSFRLDVILRFGFNVLRGPVLKTARFGVWSFHHGDNTYIRGGPACFWEMRERQPFTGAILQVLDDSIDAGLVLCKGRFGTEGGNSVNRNRVAPYWGSSHFVIQKLWETHQHGWDWVKDRAIVAEPYLGRKRMYKLPTNLEMATWITTTLPARMWGGAWGRTMRRDPSVALRNVPTLVAAGVAPELDAFNPVAAPRNHLYSHPCLFASSGRTWLFVNDLDTTLGQTNVACAEINSQGMPETFHPVAVPPGRTSPQIFESESQTWMIPSAVNEEAVELYRAVRFPYEWIFERVLFRGRVADTQVWHDGARWWFFPTYEAKRAPTSALMLYSANTLTDCWEYHPANPISLDAQVARGAGAIFRAEHRLVRPALNETPAHRARLVFREIEVLTRLEYRERTIWEAAVQSGGGGSRAYTLAGKLEGIEMLS